MYERILVAIDHSPASKAAVEHALSLAALAKGRLRLVSVVDDITFRAACVLQDGRTAHWQDRAWDGARTLLDECRNAASRSGVVTDVGMLDLRQGSVPELILQAAKSFAANLLVLGTHGRQGLGRLVLGSNAEEVLRQSWCPVLIVHGGTLPKC